MSSGDIPETYLVLKNIFSFRKSFFLKLFFIFSFKIVNITLESDLDSDPNWTDILDPDPNSMYSTWIHSTG